MSAPVVNSISFLDANINGRSIHFGEYGYTGTRRSIGYTIDEVGLGLACVTARGPVPSLRF